MAITGKWIFTAAMDVDPDKEALFNEVYDQEHVPHLQGRPRYACYVELENPDVLTSAAWAKAVDTGRWPTHVRPFTRNRQHTLHRILRDK
jgi:hypothetical protein